MTVWSLADVTRELERHENVFQELQHAIDYLDHAPAGFFSAEGNGSIVYLNATLANWLDHDLAQFSAGGLKLEDIVAGEGAALLTTLVAAPGEVRTDVFDIDLKTRAGRTVPARLLHKVAFGADGAPGPFAHARDQPLARRRQRPAARRRSALHALLPEHPDGDRHGRSRGPDRAVQPALRAAVQPGAQARRARRHGALDPVGRRRTRPSRARSRNPPRGRQGMARSRRSMPRSTAPASASQASL